MSSSVRVCILTPVMNHFPAFWRSVINMVAYSWEKGIPVGEIGITERTVVDWARNNLAKAAKEKSEYTHFLWLDADHVFNPDLLECLLSHNLKGPFIVSALYYSRCAPYLPVVYVKDYSVDVYKHFPLIEIPNNLITCDAVGFGGCLMSREVLEVVPEPWFTIDYRAGEDVAFCVKAKQYGTKIYCDGRYKLGHVGDYPIVTESTYRKYMDEHKEDYADKVRVFLGGTDEPVAKP
jgi:hypothetical protein